MVVVRSQCVEGAGFLELSCHYDCLRKFRVSSEVLSYILFSSIVDVLLVSESSKSLRAPARCSESIRT
jgi:hypothetical protein